MSEEWSLPNSNRWPTTEEPINHESWVQNGYYEQPGPNNGSQFIASNTAARFSGQSEQGYGYDTVASGYARPSELVASTSSYIGEMSLRAGDGTDSYGLGSLVEFSQPYQQLPLSFDPSRPAYDPYADYNPAAFDLQQQPQNGHAHSPYYLPPLPSPSHSHSLPPPFPSTSIHPGEQSPSPHSQKPFYFQYPLQVQHPHQSPHLQQSHQSPHPQQSQPAFASTSSYPSSFPHHHLPPLTTPPLASSNVSSIFNFSTLPPLHSPPLPLPIPSSSSQPHPIPEAAAWPSSSNQPPTQLPPPRAPLTDSTVTKKKSLRQVVSPDATRNSSITSLALQRNLSNNNNSGTWFTPNTPSSYSSPDPDRHSPAESGTSPNNPVPTMKVLTALSERRAFLSSPHPIPYNPPRQQAARDARRERDGLGDASAEPLGSAPCLVLQVSCYNCGESIARLNLRDLKGKGKARAVSPRRARYTCDACSKSYDFGTRVPDGEVEDEPSYKDTISAAIDSLSGMSLKEPAVDRPPPIVNPGRSNGDLLICDVCSRPLARGSIKRVTDGKARPPADGDPEADELAVEAICTGCDSTYQICSDCGSGGGRLSPGRWRCKELFVPGRRNCRLNHRRHPDLEDRTFTVTAIKDFPDADVDSVVAECRKMYFDTRYSALARPEVIERGESLVRSFIEVEKTTIDGWNLLAPMFRKETDCPTNIIRYLGMQTMKSKGRKTLAGVDNSSPPLGFLFAEHDLTHGALFFGFTSPWAVLGKGSDANVVMGSTIIKRAREDVAKINQQRRTDGLEPFPGITCTWLFGPWKLDSKMAQGISRRGYSALQDLGRKWDTVPAEAFPPHREFFIPSQFVKGFNFFVRPCMHDEDNADQSVPTGRTKRSRKGSSSLTEAANLVGRDLI